LKKSHEKYIHTHHINSHELLNTHRDNLEQSVFYVIITKMNTIVQALKSLEWKWS